LIKFDFNTGEVIERKIDHFLPKKTYIEKVMHIRNDEFILLVKKIKKIKKRKGNFFLLENIKKRRRKEKYFLYKVILK